MLRYLSLLISLCLFIQCKSVDQESIKNNTIKNDTNSSQTNDTRELQNLISKGGIIHLNDSYLITQPLTITKDTRIIGNSQATNGYTNIVMNNPNYDQIFRNESNVNLELSHIQTSSKGILEISSGAKEILINNCKVTNSLESNGPAIAIRVSKSKTPVLREIQNLKINSTIFENATAAFLDYVKTDSLIFDNNTVHNGINYVLRAESKLNEKQNYISFQGNTINGLKGWSKKSDKTVARVLQASATENIVYANNTIRNVKASTSANYVYWHSGNLFFENNRCSSIISNTAAIHDKGISKQYTTTIKNNTFNQSELNNQVLERVNNPKLGIININRAQNVRVEKNNFIGLQTYALRISHPFPENGNHKQLPKNIVFDGNTLNQNENSAVLVSQSVDNLRITNNVIQDITEVNSKNKRQNLIELRVTSNHEQAGIDNVIIAENTIENRENNYSLVFVNDGNYIHKTTSSKRKVNNIQITNNQIEHAVSLVKLFSKSQVATLTINDNEITNRMQSYSKVK